MMLRALFLIFLLPITLWAESPFDQKLAEHTRAPGRIGYLKITDRDAAISQATYIYVNRALAYYKENLPACIILELNTPGGEVFAAQRISDALKEMDTQYGVPVIAYINNWAISAGAMLAYSCRYIVVAKDASMGAAEPIMVGAEGKPETASEKINSALRADFANRAKYFDRNPFIAEAMVDKDIILVMRDDKIMKLDKEEQILKSDVVISSKGKLLTLNADQLIEFGVADFILRPEKYEFPTKQELEKSSWPATKSPLGQIDYLKRGQIDLFEMNWQTRFLTFLASPAVSSLLFMVMLIGIYMEISSAGFGVAGALALISMFLLLLSSFALEAIHWLEPILLLFGMALVALEFFFFPTLGILGFVGALFMIIGLLGMMLPGIGNISFEGDAINAAGEYVLARLAWLSSALLVSIGVIAVLSRFMWPKYRVVQKLVLTDDMRSEAGIQGTMVPSILTSLPEVGQIAIVSKTLRPAGKITIGDIEYDAVSTGSYVVDGTKVRVQQIDGQIIHVEELFS